MPPPSQSPADDPAIRLSVHPAPADEELAAIVGAIGTLRRRAAEADAAGPDRPVPSRWAIAGRREAMRGLDRDDDTGSRA